MGAVARLDASPATSPPSSAICAKRATWHLAAGRGALHRACWCERESLAVDARSAARHGSGGNTTDSTARCRRWRSARRRAAPIRADCPTRGRQREPPAHGRGDARDIRRLDRALATVPGESTGLVTLPPGERCVVEPSPVFQRPVLGVASYLAPPMFSDKLPSVTSSCPSLPTATSEEDIQGRLAVEQASAAIPTTAVHEAYPGHHWHLDHEKPEGPRRASCARSTARPYFSEGWALYAERVMRERGFFVGAHPRAVPPFEATIFRAARIIVDTSLHLGEIDLRRKRSRT